MTNCLATKIGAAYTFLYFSCGCDHMQIKAYDQGEVNVKERSQRVFCCHCFKGHNLSVLLILRHSGRSDDMNVPRAAHEGVMTTANIQVRSENEGALGGPTFSPPLYRQRYAAVLDLVREIQPKRVHLGLVGRDGISMYAVRCYIAVQ